MLPSVEYSGHSFAPLSGGKLNDFFIALPDVTPPELNARVRSSTMTVNMCYKQKLRLFTAFLLGLLVTNIVSVSPSQARADYSVWDPPTVYYDFEGSPATLQVKDRAGDNNLALEKVGDSQPVLATLGKVGRALA